jgi:hypothetical protein
MNEMTDRYLPSRKMIGFEDLLLIFDFGVSCDQLCFLFLRACAFMGIFRKIYGTPLVGLHLCAAWRGKVRRGMSWRATVAASASLHSLLL